MSSESPRAGERPVKVLVVDDEDSLRSLIARMLQRHGYRTLEAETGEGGLEIFRSARPDIVVTDVRMPGMNGLDLLRAIKEESPDACVTVMTGYGTEETAIEAIRHGASNYFKKPFGKSEFIYAIGVLADLISSRRDDRFDFHCTVEESKTLEVGNDLGAIYNLINELTRTVSHLDFDVEAIRVGLLETLSNAIEHGNLGISGEEKQEALQKSKLDELYRLRVASPPARDTKVRISYRFTPGEVRYRIEDEGRGFNWKDLPEPSDPSNLLKSTGRGIILTRLSMDETVYEEPGNAVTITKLSRGALRS